MYPMSLGAKNITYLEYLATALYVIKRQGTDNPLEKSQ